VRFYGGGVWDSGKPGPLCGCVGGRCWELGEPLVGLLLPDWSCGRRAARLLDSGFEDAFRALYPKRVQYTVGATTAAEGDGLVLPWWSWW